MINKTHIKNTVLDYVNKGFFYIFGSSVISEIIAFLLSVFIVRKFNKTDYGMYCIAYNLYAYFAIFIGIGLINGIMQYCSERRSDDEKSSIYRFSFRLGTLATIIICILIIFASFCHIDDNPTVNKYLLSLSGLPLVTYLSSFLQTYVRIQRNNKLYAYANIAASFTHLFFSMIATQYLSIYGYIISAYIYQTLKLIITWVFTRKTRPINFLRKPKLKSNNLFDDDVYDYKSSLIKYSVLCCVTNLTSSLLVLLDITCLNTILDDATVIASYKIAQMIPTALLFIPSSYLIFIYPYLAESNSNCTALNFLIKKSLITLGTINLLISIFLLVFTKQIIIFIWGESYLDCLPIFRILIINYFVAGTFRKLYGNILVVVKKVNINLFNTFFAGILNIILNIILIQKEGSIGAAKATLIVTVVTSMTVYIYYTVWLRKQNK